MLMLARKFADYRLHMTGNTKQAALSSSWTLKAENILTRLYQNEEN